MNRYPTLALPVVATLVAFAVLLSLGLWQLDRLRWKEALIARVEAGLGAVPVAAPGPGDWAGIDLAEVEYRPVSVTGRYLSDAEVFVNQTLTDPRGRFGGFGFMVATPFASGDGWIVYVNRGFVPRQRKDQETRVAGLIEGKTTVVGLLRQPRRRAWFMPADDVAGNEWFSRDPALFAAAQGRAGEAVAPYLIDARFDPTLPGGLPQGGETIVSFPNNHLQYALTWFGLTAGLAGVFAVFAWGRLKAKT
ncbi:MAG: SURF1 family protein [Bauldia sp.]